MRNFHKTESSARFKSRTQTPKKSCSNATGVEKWTASSSSSCWTTCERRIRENRAEHVLECACRARTIGRPMNVDVPQDRRYPGSPFLDFASYARYRTAKTALRFRPRQVHFLGARVDVRTRSLSRLGRQNGRIFRFY